MTFRQPIPLAILAAVVAVGACQKAAPAKRNEAEQARSVSVIRLEPRTISGALTASGDLVAREEAAVAPEVTGYRVTRVLADVGDYVRAGQVLAQLDPSLLEAQVAQARAQAAQAEDQARRVADLDGTGVLSQEQISQRRFQAQASAANLRALQTQRGKLAVTAPVSGLIVERTVRPGDLSAGGATPWFRMVRDGQVELSAQLSAEDLARVRPGQTAQVTVAGGLTAPGRVRLVSPQINAQTRLGEVRVSLPARPDIRVGGFGRAVFGDAIGQGLAAPESAIRYDADGASVMVVGPDNRVRRVLVQAGARGGGWVQLTRGPPAGSRLVRSAPAMLLDGDMVRPVEAAAPAAAPAAARAAP